MSTALAGDDITAAITIIHDVAFDRRHHDPHRVVTAQNTLARSRHTTSGALRDAIEHYLDDSTWRDGHLAVRWAIHQIATHAGLANPDNTGPIAEQPTLFPLDDLDADSAPAVVQHPPRTLERMDGYARQRSNSVGPAARPVATPDDLDQITQRAHGVVELPPHIRWSDPPRAYDLDDRADRILAYEQIMTEGGDDDIRRYIDPDHVIALWDDLVLSPHVRQAWTHWARHHRNLDLPC